MEKDREREIILRILQGEREAYALLVDEYKAAVFNLTYRMTGNYEDASDLAQETFVRAYANLEKFHTDRRFFAWLYTIALNIIRNHLKKESLSRAILFRWFRGHDQDTARSEDVEGRKSVNVAPSTVMSGATPETELLETEQTQKLASCLNGLPPEQREAVVLRFYQAFSFEEMADILEISQSAVKMRVYRALERLKRLIKEDG